MNHTSDLRYDFVAPRQIVFGWGRRREVGTLGRTLGSRAFLVCGLPPAVAPDVMGEIAATLRAAAIRLIVAATIEHEPEVADVDRVAAEIRQQNPGPGDFMLAVGGGAAIDLAKAAAAMAVHTESPTVKDYLEGVGRGLELVEPPLPVLAMPTTAGTGAEATRNAVISSYDPPFKKSLRDDRLMPQIALVDPELTVSVPAAVTAAWQQILVFDCFRYGQVNRATEVRWCSSGKVFNAGIAAHHLGGPSLTLAPVGGPVRREIERELGELGVPCRWVVTRAATRVCTTIVDRSSGAISELVENGRPLNLAELDMFCDAYAEEAANARAALITGSLPEGTPLSIYHDLVKHTPCPAVLDFRGEGLLAVLDLAPYVVKPNREELAQTIGSPLTTDEELRQAMLSLNRRGAQWVVVTQGAGPVWLSSTSKVYRLHPLPAEGLVNPIGSGDAMGAAIAWATRDGRSIVDAVRLGMAAAAENLRELLPCRLDPAAVRRRAAEVGVEEL